MTGKGSIVASRKHATQVSQGAIEAYLGVSDDEEAARPSKIDAAAAAIAERVADLVGQGKAIAEDQEGALRDRMQDRQKAVGYGDGKSWNEKVGPPCETVLGRRPERSLPKESLGSDHLDWLKSARHMADLRSISHGRGHAPRPRDLLRLTWEGRLGRFRSLSIRG